MAGNSPTNWHVNTLLTNAALVYPAGKYIADFVSPRIMVDKSSDKVFKMLRKDITTPKNDLIGPNSKPSEVGYDTGEVTFTCVDRGLTTRLPFKEIQDSDPIRDPRRRRLFHVMNMMALNHEIRVADLLDASGSYASSNVIAAAAAWGNTTTGRPIEDIHNAINLLPGSDDGATQYKTVMALEQSLFFKLIRHPDVRGLLGGNDRGLPNMALIAEAFGLDEVHVSNADKNTAAEGATEVHARIWDTDKARILRVPVGTPDMPLTKDTSAFHATFTQRFAGVPADVFQLAADLSVEPFTVVQEQHMPMEGGSLGTLMLKIARCEDDSIVLQNDMGVLITGC